MLLDRQSLFCYHVLDMTNLLSCSLVWGYTGEQLF